jgi:hypothetical protein
MDYLVFLDDDDIPYSRNQKRADRFMGRPARAEHHMKYIKGCGYHPRISLRIHFSDSESQVQRYTERIGFQDIFWRQSATISQLGIHKSHNEKRWSPIRGYGVLVQDKAAEVAEINHAKLISGANLLYKFSQSAAGKRFL